MFYNCTGIKNIKYKNIVYTSSSTFATVFEANGGTISSNAFTDSEF